MDNCIVNRYRTSEPQPQHPQAGAPAAPAPASGPRQESQIGSDLLVLWVAGRSMLNPAAVSGRVGLRRRCWFRCCAWGALLARSTSHRC